MGLLSGLKRMARPPFGAEMLDAAGDIIPRAARHAPFGGLVGAGVGGTLMSPEGTPVHEQASNMTNGMGIGLAAGALAGGGRGVARLAQVIFQSLKKEAPQIDDMTAWAIAQRRAHDLEMGGGQ